MEGILVINRDEIFWGIGWFVAGYDKDVGWFTNVVVVNIDCALNGDWFIGSYDSCLG